MVVAPSAVKAGLFAPESAPPNDSQSNLQEQPFFLGHTSLSIEAIDILVDFLYTMPKPLRLTTEFTENHKYT